MKSMNFVEVPNGIQDFSKAVPQTVINSNKVSYYQESPNSNQFLLFHHPSHTLYYGPKFDPTFSDKLWTERLKTSNGLY